MTTRIITITDTDLAALTAARPIVGDASHWPGRAEAIAALDRLAKAPDDGDVVRAATVGVAGYRVDFEYKPTMLDFIKTAWPMLHPDKPLEVTPTIKMICKYIDNGCPDNHQVRLWIDDPHTVGASEPDEQARAAAKFWYDSTIPVDIRVSYPGTEYRLSEPGVEGMVRERLKSAGKTGYYTAEEIRQAATPGWTTASEPSAEVTSGGQTWRKVASGKAGEIRQLTAKEQAVRILEEQVRRLDDGRSVGFGDVAASLGIDRDSSRLARAEFQRVYSGIGDAPGYEARIQRTIERLKVEIIGERRLREVNHIAYDTKCKAWRPGDSGCAIAAPGVVGRLIPSVIAELYNWRSFDVWYDASEAMWQATADINDRKKCFTITDRELAESPLPSSVWFDKIKRLALELRPDAVETGSKDAQLVAILTGAAK